MVAACAFIVCLLVILYLVGPRIERDTTIHAKQLPENLDLYLNRQESLHHDIIPGAEKTIVWAGHPGDKTPLSIIYLHGFSACRQEMAPTPELVAKELGANLFYTRFTGHGRSGEAIAEASVNSWLNDADEAMLIGRKLGEKVIVIGNSTGSTVATWLATQPIADHIAALILLSPNYGLADRRSRFLAWPWGRQLAELVLGPTHGWEAHNEAYHRYWSHRFPTRALLPVIGIVTLTLSQDLGSISNPTLVIHSPKDEVVDPTMIGRIFARIGSDKKRLIDDFTTDAPSNHILAGDILSPATTGPLTEIIVRFIEETGNGD